MDTVVITQLNNLNLSNLKTNELKNRYIHVRWKDAKQDIQGSKQDIQEIKQDIEIRNELSTKQNSIVETCFVNLDMIDFWKIRCTNYS